MGCPHAAAHDCVVPTRLPLVEKSSLKRTVADAAANRTLTKKIRSIFVALHEP
jgi:hypothetical protein